MLGTGHAGFESGGQGVAEQSTSFVQSQLFAGVQDRAVGGILGDLVELRGIGKGLFEEEAFGIVRRLARVILPDLAFLDLGRCETLSVVG